MTTDPLALRGVRSDWVADADGRSADLPGFEVIGLQGVLGGGYRARRSAVPGSLVTSGLRWRLADQWSGTWWPQGIAVGDHAGTPVALVSWYAQPRRGLEQGARISVIDLSDPRRPTYRHVLLASPRMADGRVILDPVLAHAGGIAWVGDRLLVAATFDGIREFRMRDIMRAQPKAAPFGYRYVLPQFAHHRAVEPKAPDRMRYSFLGLETTSKPAAGTRTATGLNLVAGEYHRDSAHRIARLTFGPDRTVVDETSVPGVAHMQGVALHDGVWFISASRGDRLGGDLWSGPIDHLRRHEDAVPPGPEDLAVWPSRNELWSVSEPRGKRWVYAMNLANFE